ALLGLAQLADDGLERLDHFVPRGAALVEAELEVERLGRRPEGEDVVLRASWPRPGRRLAHLLPCDAALTGDLLDEGGHFLGGILSNYLQQQRLRRNVGQPTQVADLLRHGVQRQRFGDRGPRLAEAPRQVL